MAELELFSRVYIAQCLPTTWRRNAINIDVLGNNIIITYRLLSINHSQEIISYSCFRLTANVVQKSAQVSCVNKCVASHYIPVGL